MGSSRKTANGAAAPKDAPAGAGAKNGRAGPASAANGKNGRAGASAANERKNGRAGASAAPATDGRARASTIPRSARLEHALQSAAAGDFEVQASRRAAKTR